MDKVLLRKILHTVQFITYIYKRNHETQLDWTHQLNGQDGGFYKYWSSQFFSSDIRVPAIFSNGLYTEGLCLQDAKQNSCGTPTSKEKTYLDSFFIFLFQTAVFRWTAYFGH